MPQYCSEPRGLTGPLVLFLLAVLAIAGCATTGPARQGAGETERSKMRDKDRPRVEVDGDQGFTVTEVVRIGSDVRADYQEALRLLEQERTEEGIALLEDLVERAPEVTAPHIDLGVAYGQVGEHQKAEDSLRAALDLAPNHPAALNEMGIVYRRTGRFDEARASYERALAVHPGYHYARRNLGVLCDLYLSDLECALEHYEVYAQIVSDDEQVAIWIADLRIRLGV